MKKIVCVLLVLVLVAGLVACGAPAQGSAPETQQPGEGKRDGAAVRRGKQGDRRKKD